MRSFSIRVAAFAGACIMLGAGQAAAQASSAVDSGTVVILVSDKGTTLPVASVTLQRLNGGMIGVTDADGKYTAKLPVGPGAIIVRGKGYVPVKVDISVRAAVTDTVRATLGSGDAKKPGSPK